MVLPKDEWTGQWRVFVLDPRTAREKECDQLIRIHLMEDEAVSFGFVEQRLTTSPRHSPDDHVTFYVYGPGVNTGFADSDYQQVPTLREGMTIIEWLWQTRKERSSHE